MICYRTSVLQAHLFKSLAVQLGLEGTKSFCELYMGPQSSQQVSADRGDVHRVDNNPPIDKFDDLLRDLHGDVDLGVACGGPQVWRADDLVEL